MIDLKLDTLHKKPKVYNVALLTLAAAALLILLLLLGGEQALRLSCLLLALYFLGVTALLIRAFFLQMRYNLYSYNTIIYFGFALFTLFIFLLYFLLFFELRQIPPKAMGYGIISRLLYSARDYMLYSFPFLLIFSAAMVCSNLSLIRHEGFRPVNLLGILLAFLLVGGGVGMWAWDYNVSGSETEVMIHDLVTNFAAAVYLYFECMMLGTMVADAIAARYVPKGEQDYIIILGCGIRRDGTPSPLLRGRVDRALAYAKAQEARGGKAPIFVLSGGKGPDECISEAESMRRYLASQGIPEEQMILEDRSTDTAENMAFSMKKLPEGGKNLRVAFSTTNYHVFRSGLKARRVKLRALGMGCRSKWYFWPNAAVREFVGLLTQHRIKQGLILLGLILSYLGLTLLHYRM